MQEDHEFQVSLGCDSTKKIFFRAAIIPVQEISPDWSVFPACSEFAPDNFWRHFWLLQLGLQVAPSGGQWPVSPLNALQAWDSLKTKSYLTHNGSSARLSNACSLLSQHPLQLGYTCDQEITNVASEVSRDR
jgi:hypothetical protein